MEAAQGGLWAGLSAFSAGMIDWVTRSYVLGWSGTHTMVWSCQDWGFMLTWGGGGVLSQVS